MRNSRSYTTLAAAVIVAAVIVSATVFVALGSRTTVTETVPGTTTSSGSTCTFASEGFLLMKVLNGSNGEPVGSLPVQVEALQPACSSGPSVREDLGTIDTNSSGFLSLGGPYDWYYLALSNGPRSYSVNASISAGALTCVTLSMPSGDVNITQECNQADYFGHQTTTTSTSTSSLSVPPPTTTVIDYGCSALGQSSTETSSSSAGASTVLLVNTSKGSAELDMNDNAATSLETAGCSYTYTNVTTPTACGVMCGGGIGYTYQYSYVLKLNFSLSSGTNVASQNLTISQGSGLSGVFPEPNTQLTLNSQKVTWYSNPPCSGEDGQGVQSDCMSTNATSMIVELPSPVQSGAFQLVITSAIYLVP